MISRWILHVEAHWGYRPRLSIRRMPRAGDVVWNGDILCRLERCQHCGEGFLAREVQPRVDRHAGTRSELGAVPDPSP